MFIDDKAGFSSKGKEIYILLYDTKQQEGGLFQGGVSCSLLLI